MRRLVAGWVCLALLVGARLAWGGEAPAAPPLDELKQKVQKLRDEEKGLRAELDKIDAKVKQSPELKPLREAADKAAKDYDEKRKTDEGVVRASKAVKEADAAVEKVIQENLTASDAGKAILAGLQDLAKKIAESEFDGAVAKLALTHPSSPLNFALSRDTELADIKLSIFLSPDKEARTKAQEAYDKARKTKLEDHPEAKKLFAQIAACKKGLDDLGQADRELRKKLFELRQTLAKSDDPAIKDARDKVAAVRKALDDAATTDALNAVRKTRDEATMAYDAKRRELLDADKDAAKLRADMNTLHEQRAEFDKKIREQAK